MKITIKELAAKTGLDAASLNGFLRTCVALGAVEAAGSVKKEGTKGRAAKLFDIPEKIVINAPNGILQKK